MAQSDALDNVANALKALQKRYIGNIPADATYATYTNAVLITSTSLQDIKAAPAAGYSDWVLSVDVSNPTAAETPLITIQDTASSPIVVGVVSPGASASKRVVFEPPIQLTALKKLQGKADSSVGDVTVVATIATALTPA